MSQYTVLTIDDDVSARVLFKLMLERHGFDVVQAEDADDAISLLDNFKPDLILTDISLPGMDGIELTATLRQREDLKHIPIIVLSAFHNTDTIDKALAAGADEFYKKPLVMENLKERLETVIANRINK